MWDVTDPARPTRVNVIVSGLRETHKNWWECDTGMAYLVSGAPGWRTKRMAQVYDLSDPPKPVFIRNFGLPGQQPGSTGPPPTEMHGAMSLGPKGNRVYSGYGTTKAGSWRLWTATNFFTVRRSRPIENLESPLIARLDLPPNVGAHTYFRCSEWRFPTSTGSAVCQAGFPGDHRRNNR